MLHFTWLTSSNLSKVVYSDQLLCAACQIHVVYSDQLLGAARHIHLYLIAIFLTILELRIWCSDIDCKLKCSLFFAESQHLQQTCRNPIPGNQHANKKIKRQLHEHDMPNFYRD